VAIFASATRCISAAHGQLVKNEFFMQQHIFTVMVGIVFLVF